MFTFLYSDPKSVIRLKANNGTRFADFREIVYVESDRYHIIVHLSDESKLTMTGTLKNMMRKLGEKMFYQVHRKYIANVGYVKEIVDEPSGKYIILKTTDKIDVSGDRLPGLYRYFR